MKGNTRTTEKRLGILLCLLAAVLLALGTGYAKREQNPVAIPEKPVLPAIPGEGTWYVLGGSYGGYLTGSETPVCVRGRLKDLSENAAFRLYFNGNVLMILSEDGSRALSVSEDGTVCWSTDTTSERAVWNIYGHGYYENRSFVVLQNYVTKELLTENEDGSLGLLGEDDYRTEKGTAEVLPKAVWNLRNTAEYGDGCLREELHSFTASNLEINDFNATYGTVLTKYAKAALTEKCDFLYTFSSDILSVSETGELKPEKAGTTKVTAVHKYSGLTATFNVHITSNAILVVPGILGSDLCDSVTGETLWSNGVFQDAQSLTTCYSALKKLERVLGNPNDRTIVPVRNNYGVGDGYKNLTERLISENPGGYTVEFYAYDWRQSPETLGAELSDYIKEKGYEQVTFVAHSMGGLVVSHYLAISEENRAKTAAVVSLGTPFLGAPALLNLWGGSTDNISALLGTAEIPDAVLTLLKNKIQSYLGMMPSVYALLPTEQAFSEPDTWTPLLNAAFSDTDSLYAKFLKNFDADLYKKAKEANDRLYESGQHIILTTENVYLVDGLDTETSWEVGFTADGVTCISSENGDDTVPFESSTLLSAIPDRTCRWNLSHMGLAGAYGYADAYWDCLLQWVYGK